MGVGVWVGGQEGRGVRVGGEVGVGDRGEVGGGDGVGIGVSVGTVVGVAVRSEAAVSVGVTCPPQPVNDSTIRTNIIVCFKGNVTFTTIPPKSMASPHPGEVKG